VYRYFRTRTGSADDADDLTQQTFTNAWRAFSQSSHGCDATAAWIFTIARHVAVDHYRHARFRKWFRLEVDEHAAAEDVESMVLGAEDNHLIYQLVSELPKGKRDLIALRFAAELTIPEIARVTGRTPEATRKQISRTLERLEAGFRERD
jgi:RNA polymerase sigma-70 factor, ECF subfamily